MAGEFHTNHNCLGQASSNRGRSPISPIYIWKSINPNQHMSIHPRIDVFVLHIVGLPNGGALLGFVHGAFPEEPVCFPQMISSEGSRLHTPCHWWWATNGHNHYSLIGECMERSKTCLKMTQGWCECGLPLSLRFNPGHPEWQASSGSVSYTHLTLPTIA